MFRMTLFQQICIVAAMVASGLVAGLMFSYSCSVNPGLAALPDKAYLQAMQSINVAILNPAFFACFAGLLLLWPLAAWSVFSRPDKAAFFLLLAAAAIYLFGVFILTMAGNVPLNNRLATFDIASASVRELAEMRRAFAPDWNRFHSIRTAASVISFALGVIALVRLSTSAR
jgi:uncharacterized membrane protein